MDAFNTKYFAEQLEVHFTGGKHSVYNKVNLMMKGFRGGASQEEVDALKREFTQAYNQRMKLLNKL